VNDTPKDGTTTKIAPLWGVKEVAAFLNVTVQTVYALRAKGIGPEARPGRQAPAIRPRGRDRLVRTAEGEGCLMARPSLPLGSYGKITFLTEGKAHVARVQFRDFDGVVRTVRRAGKTKAAAERALKAALVERQAPIAQAQLTGACLFSKAAEGRGGQPYPAQDRGQLPRRRERVGAQDQ
jgi:hypothetical protein